MNINQINYYEEDIGWRIYPCVEIIVFTDAPLVTGPHPGLLNFYEAFRRRMTPFVRWYRTNAQGHFNKLKPATLDMVPFWFEDKRNKEEGLLGLMLKSGDLPTDMQSPSFEFFCDQLPRSVTSGVFQMTLPLWEEAQQRERIVPLVVEALQDFPLVSGYVGYTVFWDTLDFRFEKRVFNREMARRHMRYPGLGYSQPTYLREYAVEDGLVGVNWITLLGPKPLAQLGGLEALQTKLSAPIDVQPLACLGGGAMIIAGDKPQLGDLEAGDDIPLYKEVGHALREARCRRPFYAGEFENSVAHQWFHRFFGED